MITNIIPVHIFTYASAQINVYHANKGEGLTRHSHIFSHATVCHSGSCLVNLEGRSYTVNKDSQPLNLPANEWHEIEALEDNTVFVNIFEEGKQ
jgi:quercetin dioxygenase-like cupin family protein